MIHENQKIEEPSTVLVRAKGDMLYDNHRQYENPHIIGVRLEGKEALYAAIVTAKALATETAKPLWYRVINYLEEKYKIKYG